jgi:hypothetical protein
MRAKCRKERTMSHVIRTLMITSLITTYSCASVPHRDLARLKDGLRIHVTYPKTIKIGSVLRIPFKLVNTSDHRIKTCISQRRGMQVIDSSGRAASSLVLVDHESCEETVNLAPRSALDFIDELQVDDDLIPGPGKVVLGVSVISFRRCAAGTGCYSVWVSGGLGYSSLVSPPMSSEGCRGAASRTARRPTT